MRRYVRWGALAAVVALVVAAGASTVLAAGAPRGPAMVMWSFPEARAGWRALDLTQEQIDRIEEIQQKALEQALPIRTELFSKRQELALALRSATPDAARVKALVEEINRLQGQLQQIQIQAQLDIRGVLTEEQRARLGTPWFGRDRRDLGVPLGPGGPGWGMPWRGHRMMTPGWCW